MRLIFSLICIDIGSAHILSNLRLNKNEKKDGVLTASYETTIDLHVSHITRLFLADELNKEWNSRLSVQRTLSTREHGEIVYHLYDLPWPLSPRELLMKCDRSIDHRAHQLTSSCYSVEDESLPKSTDAVRVELRHTEWRITSLPDERTHIQLFIEIPASAAIAVPNFIVRYCQRSLLRDSVRGHSRPTHERGTSHVCTRDAHMYVTRVQTRCALAGLRTHARTLTLCCSSSLPAPSALAI